MRSLSAEYLAGFFDGEGCIHAHKNLKNMNVFLTQKDPAILYMVAAVYGGTPKLNKRNKCYLWSCPGSMRETSLRDIRPFVISKKEQVDLALLWEQAKEKSMVRDSSLGSIQYSIRFATRKDRRREKEQIRLALIAAKTKQYGHVRGNYSVPN